MHDFILSPNGKGKSICMHAYIYMYMCIYTYIYDIIFIPSSIGWWTQVVSVSWILWIYDLSCLSLDDAQFISSTALSLVCVFNWSIVSYSATLWTVAHQAHLSMEFSKQKYWSRLPFPPPGDLPDPGIEPASLASPAWTGRFFTTVSAILLIFYYTIFSLKVLCLIHHVILTVQCLIQGGNWAHDFNWVGVQKPSL